MLDLEVDQLEEILEGEVKCESKHRNPEALVCTVEVVAIIACRCSKEFKGCQSITDYTTRSIEASLAPDDRVHVCGNCYGLVHLCWSVRPI